MEDTWPGPRGGPHSACRTRTGPFASFVAEAARNADAAVALATMYADLAPDLRRRLAEAVWRDGRASDMDPAPALLTLLSVEEDLDNARYLQALLWAGSPSAVAHGVVPMAWLEDGGGAVLAQPLHGPFVEVLGLSWRDDTLIDWEFEPLATAGEVSSVMDRLGLRPRPAPTEVVLDALVQVLWRHHRAGGSLPGPAHRFAHLL
jgi:hypothetical protein